MKVNSIFANMRVATHHFQSLEHRGMSVIIVIFDNMYTSMIVILKTRFSRILALIVNSNLKNCGFDRIV